MYVCLCQGITDRQIRAAADDGARSVRDLNRRLGVGTGCGKCTRCAREVLAEHQVRVAAPVPAGLSHSPASTPTSMGGGEAYAPGCAAAPYDAATA